VALRVGTRSSHEAKSHRIANLVSHTIYAARRRPHVKQHGSLDAPPRGRLRARRDLDCPRPPPDYTSAETGSKPPEGRQLHQFFKTSGWLGDASGSDDEAGAYTRPLLSST
jgi:hypothetical protein